MGKEKEAGEKRFLLVAECFKEDICAHKRKHSQKHMDCATVNNQMEQSRANVKS